ncbi:TIGR01212 family radical SAM protein [Sporofaciens musculi]|mgnify:CR=1 FL=1|jgi:radical SAM protein (TIGR01212 family)|uniref:TIGR01212 family radical SAM protein n=1 Tax=Sporofaciens musculi TaxID=2681861 RepID=UPI00257044D8|nr:TIGR01212 family radical SAM protein [Sporofaciens musculi]
MVQELPYYAYSEYLKDKYGEKVYKLPVNLPVSCPNRLTGRGCAFCSEKGAGFEAMDCRVPVKEQLKKTRQRIETKYHARKFIAYFQNYTNTFLPLTQFCSYVDEAAGVQDVVELAISTRPDCISLEYLEALLDVRRRYGSNITIELGLQTSNYHTLMRMNRGHTLAEFIDAVLAVQAYGFEVCAHVILNLPNDELSDTIETAKILSALRVQTVKAHSLYLAKGTALCDAYERGEVTICSKEEYLKRLASFLDYLSPKIGVERLFSRIPFDDAIFCNWGTSWWKLRDELLEYMREKGSFQGRKFHYLNGSALKQMQRTKEQEAF